MLIRIFAGTVVGGIVMFILGFLIYGLALEPYLKANMVSYAGLMKEQPDFPLLIGANLVFGLLLAFVGDYWARVRSFGGGAKLGLIISFITVLYFSLMMAAFMNLYIALVPVIVDIIASTVMGAIAGGAVGVVLGKMDKGN